MFDYSGAIVELENKIKKLEKQHEQLCMVVSFLQESIANTLGGVENEKEHKEIGACGYGRDAKQTTAIDEN